MAEPRFPNVTVQLSGEDGNAFFIMGRVAAALRKAGVSAEQIAEYRRVAMSGDYDNLLRVTMQWVETS